MMKGIVGIADFDMLVSISAGYAGAKEWVQYSVSPTLTGRKPLKFVAGSTGVQTPQLIPYYPNQMAGILGAIKGAAEYEYLVNQAVLKADPGAVVPPRFQEVRLGRRRIEVVAREFRAVAPEVGGEVDERVDRQGPRLVGGPLRRATAPAEELPKPVRCQRDPQPRPPRTHDRLDGGRGRGPGEPRRRPGQPRTPRENVGHHGRSLDVSIAAKTTPRSHVSAPWSVSMSRPRRFRPKPANSSNLLSTTR